MIMHENTVMGLGDGGAHVGTICDASFITSLITHWGRDRTRGERIDVETLVKAQTHDTARAVDLTDRGTLEPGMRADVNVIDFDNLNVRIPEIVHDLPAGGARLQQKADGYLATLVAGEVTYVNAAALDKTLECGMATFWSTSRGELWTKGETSGDYLAVVEILVDCDQDALVYRVEPKGSGACHTKSPETGRARSSCFYRSIDLANRTLRKLPG